MSKKRLVPFAQFYVSWGWKRFYFEGNEGYIVAQLLWFASHLKTSLLYIIIFSKDWEIERDCKLIPSAKGNIIDTTIIILPLYESLDNWEICLDIISKSLDEKADHNSWAIISLSFFSEIASFVTPRPIELSKCN